MSKISLLDCTLRDGGYVNDWLFGESAIFDIKAKLEESNIDIIELGFLKNETPNSNRTVFKSVNQINPFIGKKKKETLYTAMVDVQGRIPVEMISPVDETVDIIRVIIWKRTLSEDVDYCRQIVEKGYKLCVQPARVDQYSDAQFVDMIRLFEPLNPMAIYVVDSWGTQSITNLAHYFKLADDVMRADIALGYHGHNNLQQGFGAAEKFIENESQRERIIDTSVYGIGRGAGNLNTETIALLLNQQKSGKYKFEPLVDIYSKYISKIYQDNKWGYSMPLYVTAVNNCNPEHALYCEKIGLNDSDVMTVIKTLVGEEKIRFDPNVIDNTVEKLGLRVK